VLALSEKLYSSFANYLFREQTLVAQYTVCSRGVGTIQRNLYWPHLKRITVFFPPREEQERIAAFLDERTAAIDDAIAKKQRLLILLDEQRAILIQRCVTRGLDSNVPLKDSGIEWLGQIPEHWEVRKLKFLFQEHTERSQTEEVTSLSMSQKFGLIESDKFAHKTLQSETSIGSKLCQRGDIVLNRLKAHLAVFSVAPMDGAVSPDYSIFRAKKRKVVNSKYYERLLKTSIYKTMFSKLVKGIVVGFYRLYSEDFLSSSVPLPPLDEQKAIVAHLEAYEQQHRAVVNATEQEIELLKEYKQTLIASAVTGQIRV
jgi:type I restriction enzyme S subunit